MLFVIIIFVKDKVILSFLEGNPTLPNAVPCVHSEVWWVNFTCVKLHLQQRAVCYHASGLLWTISELIKMCRTAFLRPEIIN